MDLRATAGHLNVVPSESKRRVTKSNIGDYGSGILCQECDQILAAYDEYGKQVLIDDIHPIEEIARAGVVAGWTITDCEPIRLEKFFLAILWRASISNRKFFLKVKLGPYEKILKDYLWGEDTSHDSFGCVVAKFRASRLVRGVEKTMLDPHRFKYEKMNYYRLYLGGYAIWIRVDRKKPTDSIGRYELDENTETVVFSRSFDESKEFQLIQKGVLAHGRKT